VGAPVDLRLRPVASNSHYDRFATYRRMMLTALGEWLTHDASADRDVVLDEIHGTASAVVQLAELLVTGRPK
jgi:hypothetical protein